MRVASPDWPAAPPADRSGPAARTRPAGRLERLGFKIVRVGTAKETAATTLIIDRAGRDPVTRLLAEFLGKPRILRQAQGADGDITVLLPRDYVSISLLVPSR